MANGVSTIVLSDLSGRRLIERRWGSTDQVLDLGEQPSGVYVLSLFAEGVVWNARKRTGCHTNIPTIVALNSEASVPPNKARKPNSLSHFRLLGASDPMPPIWMPMLAKLAKPHRK